MREHTRTNQTEAYRQSATPETEHSLSPVHAGWEGGRCAKRDKRKLTRVPRSTRANEDTQINLPRRTYTARPTLAFRNAWGVTRQLVRGGLELVCLSTCKLERAASKPFSLPNLLDKRKY